MKKHGSGKMEFSLRVLLLVMIAGAGFCWSQSEVPPAVCDPADRAALLGFKAGISKDTTGALATWVGSDCCGGGWEGIQCGGPGGRVDRLILQRPAAGDVFMKGRLSPSLGGLPFLETIIISGMKRIGAAIPDSLSNLSRLQHLVLDDNALRGAVPSSFGRLKNLQTLSVGGNHLTGSIAPILGSLTNLRQMNLAKNSLSGQIPEALYGLTALESLDLSYNSFSGPIPGFLGKLHNLTYLVLSSNRFSGQIPTSLCNLVLLSELSLDQNQLTGRIPLRIGNLRSVSVLSLSSNNLTGVIPESISQLHSLWSLNLSRNHFSNPFPDSGLPSVLSIDLSYSGLDLETVPSWIRNGELIDVRLAGCKLRGSLPNFTKPDSLTSIDLSDNYFTSGISSFLQMMNSLQTANISHNFLYSDVSSIRLPDQISVVDLHSNRLFGSVSAILGNETNRFLEVFDVSHNRISGSIPEFGVGLNLKVLNLGSNEITGRIPASVSNLQQLVRFDASRNRISGEIPSTMGKLVGLQWFDISVNGIMEKIPVSLLGIKRLKHANFRSNKLCGEIPQGRPFNIFPAAAYAHNLCLCGKPLPPCKGRRRIDEIGQ